MEMINDASNIWSHALDIEWINSPLLLGKTKDACNMLSQALEFDWVTFPPPLLMGMRKGVSSICSHPQDIGWVRLSSYQWQRRKTFATFEVMHFSLVEWDSPRSNGNEKKRLQNLESCNKDWMGKTPPLLMEMAEDVSYIWSHALKFGCVRFTPW